MSLERYTNAEDRPRLWKVPAFVSRVRRFDTYRGRLDKTGTLAGAFLVSIPAPCPSRIDKATFLAAIWQPKIVMLGAVAGRPKNEEPTRKVEPRLPQKAYAQLQNLADIGTYGSNPTDVARYLILRELDDLLRAGVLKTPSD